jgi:hypothetical protein
MKKLLPVVLFLALAIMMGTNVAATFGLDSPKPAVQAPAAPAVTAPAKPAAPDPEIQQKIANQQKRIEEGIKSNQLTLNEAKILESNLSKIRDEEKLARQDGTLSKEDKADLLGML